MVREAWSGQDNNLARAISGFTLKAQKWNKKVFGNVFTKKRQIMDRLLGTQKAIANIPTPFLVDLQNHLSKEYNQILQLEEEI